MAEMTQEQMKQHLRETAEKALASGSGSDADRCAECGCKAPGHKLDCVSSNERARKYQAELSAKYLNRGRRKGKRRNNIERNHANE